MDIGGDPSGQEESCSAGHSWEAGLKGQVTLVFAWYQSVSASHYGLVVPVTRPRGPSCALGDLYLQSTSLLT